MNQICTMTTTDGRYSKADQSGSRWPSMSWLGPGGRGRTSLAGRHGADNIRDHQPLGAAWQERNSRSPDCSDPQSILTCARPRLTVIVGEDQAFLDQARARGDVSPALVVEVLDAGTHSQG